MPVLTSPLVLPKLLTVCAKLSAATAIDVAELKFD
jgi:hypothetical protein